MQKRLKTGGKKKAILKLHLVCNQSSAKDGAAPIKAAGQQGAGAACARPSMPLWSRQVSIGADLSQDQIKEVQSMAAWWGALGAGRLTDSSASIVASIIATLPLALRALQDIAVAELRALPPANPDETFKWKPNKAAANKRAGYPAADISNWGSHDYGSLVSLIPQKIILSGLVQSSAAEFASASGGDDGGAVLAGKMAPAASQTQRIKDWGFVLNRTPHRTTLFIEPKKQAVAAVATVVANGVVAMHTTGDLQVVKRRGGGGGSNSADMVVDTIEGGGLPPSADTAIFIAKGQPTVLQLGGLYYDVSSLATPRFAGVDWTVATGCANTPDELDLGSPAPPGCRVLPGFTADDRYSAVWHKTGFTPQGGPLPGLTHAPGGPACISWHGGGSVWVNSRTGFWDEQVAVAFLILFGTPIPASVLKRFPMQAAQRTLMASQHRVLTFAQCPASGGQVVFEVYDDVEMQNHIGYNASLCRAIACVVAPTITGKAIPNAPLRSGTIQNKSRRRGSVAGKACRSKITLAYYDASQQMVFCPIPGCNTILTFVDHPCTGAGAKGCSHGPNGEAQAGWRLTHGSLEHSPDCVFMGPYVTSQQARLTSKSRTMLAAARKAGLGGATASRLVSVGDNAASVVTPAGARYEMQRQQKRHSGVPPPPPQTLVQPGPADSPCHWLNATRADKSVVAMVAIYTAVSVDSAESKGTVVELCLNGASYNITGFYNSHVGGIPQWSVAEDEVYGRLIKSPVPPPADVCEQVLAPGELAPEGCQLVLRAAFKTRAKNLQRFWRSTVKLDVDGTGTVSNVPGMTAVAMTFPDAEKRTWPVTEGVLCGQTMSNFIFLFDFCLPLLCGRSLYSVNYLATDGESAEIRPVLAAVAAAKAVAHGRSLDRCPSVGAVRQDRWGNCYNVDDQGSVTGRIDPSTINVKQTPSSWATLALAVKPGLGGGRLVHHRDTFHLLHKPAIKAKLGLNNYYRCVLTTLELWFLHIAQNAESSSELQLELQLMKDWLNDPNRSLLTYVMQRSGVKCGTVDPAYTAGAAAIVIQTAQEPVACTPARIYDASAGGHGGQIFMWVEWADGQPNGKPGSGGTDTLMLAQTVHQYAGYSALHTACSGIDKAILPRPLENGGDPKDTIPRVPSVALHVVSYDTTVGAPPGVAEVQYNAGPPQKRLVSELMATPGYKNLRQAYNDSRGADTTGLPAAPHFMRHPEETVTLRGAELDIISTFYYQLSVDVELIARYKIQGSLHCAGGGTGNVESHWSALKGMFGTKKGGSGHFGSRRRSDKLAEADALLHEKRERERTLASYRAMAKTYTSGKLKGTAVNALTLRALKLVENEYDAMVESQMKIFCGDDTSCVYMMPTTLHTKAAVPKGAPWSQVLRLRLVRVCQRKMMTCSCPHWVGTGLLCMHMMYALGVHNGTHVDVNLVLTRWLKVNTIFEERTMSIDAALWAHDFNDPNFEQPRGPTLSPAQFEAWEKTRCKATNPPPDGSSVGSPADRLDDSAMELHELHADAATTLVEQSTGAVLHADTEHDGKRRHVVFDSVMSNVTSRFATLDHRQQDQAQLWLEALESRVQQMQSQNGPSRTAGGTTEAGAVLPGASYSSTDRRTRVPNTTAAHHARGLATGPRRNRRRSSGIGNGASRDDHNAGLAGGGVMVDTVSVGAGAGAGAGNTGDRAAIKTTAVAVAAPKPHFELGDPPPPSKSWRCAWCYRTRFTTMCFGMNEPGAANCTHCGKAQAEAGWSLWVAYTELPAGWQRSMARRHGPKITTLIRTKWRKADAVWEGKPPSI